MDVIEQVVKNRYAIYNGDSCEIAKEIPDNSIHYTLFIQIVIEIWEIVKETMNFIITLFT